MDRPPNFRDLNGDVLLSAMKRRTELYHQKYINMFLHTRKVHECVVDKLYYHSYTWEMSLFFAIGVVVRLIC